jgi:hypothetical protein
MNMIIWQAKIVSSRDSILHGKNFDPSLLDMEPLFDPLDEITMSSSLTDDYTNQSTLSYLMSSQSRRLSTGNIQKKKKTNLKIFFLFFFLFH